MGANESVGTARSEAFPEEVHGVGNHRYATVNGLRFHYVEAGTGPLVVLLHGFPEFWYSWRYQIPALAGAGFHAVAPDLRGYNETEKPAGVHSYRLELLVADVVGLIRHAGARRAVVVGHDWGGVIAWQVAMRCPEVVERLVILNAPHPVAYRRELRRPAQRLRSWYILFFQLPWIPEWVLGARDFAFLDRVLTHQQAGARTWTAADVRLYKQALARAGSLTAALNYYRAAVRYPGGALWRSRIIPVPTLLIWGEPDPNLDIRLIGGLEPWVPNLRIERLAGAGHWVQSDAPERVNRLLLEFLAGGLA